MSDLECACIRVLEAGALTLYDIGDYSRMTKFFEFYADGLEKLTGTRQGDTVGTSAGEGEEQDFDES